jgi:hypothetical protein
MAAITHEDVADAIRSTFETEIEIAETVYVQYDNEPDKFTDSLLAQGGGVWIEHSILWGESIKVENPGTWRHVGVMQCKIYSEVDKGTAAGLAMYEKIKDAFRKTTVDGVTFTTPSLTQVGRSGKWWVLIADTPFHANDVTTG